MNKEWLLLVASVALTLGVALSVIRWLEPTLLGIPPDLQLVAIDKKIPPYFENMFRKEDFSSDSILIKDPITRVRAMPLYPDIGGYGPNDLMGFRNYSIPHSASIITLGDSQTYGNNAVIERNWPGFMLAELKAKRATLYNMSVGGWAAPQYLNMFEKALAFKPEVIIVAFYSGNDPLEGFLQVYGNSYWHDLIPDHTLTAKDAPKTTFPAPVEEHWPVVFDDGVKTVFTPSLRLASNSDHPVTRAGFNIMAEVARMIAVSASERNVKVFFTIIPTKELVYANKVLAEGMQAPGDYQTLTLLERANIEQLADTIRSYPDVTYVDVVNTLQQRAMQSTGLYPEDENGHPAPAGYEVIGQIMAGAVKSHLSVPRRALAMLEVAPGKFKYLLLQDHGLHVFVSTEVIEKNGWPPGVVEVVTKEDIAELPLRGMIDEVNPSLYGPIESL